MSFLDIPRGVDEIIARTKTKSFEGAFLALTGHVEEKGLLAWREQEGAIA